MYQKSIFEKTLFCPYNPSRHGRQARIKHLRRFATYKFVKLQNSIQWNLALKNKVGKLIKIIPQDMVASKSNAKEVQLDIMVQNTAGKLYNIEMQTTKQHFLSKRMHYYQCAIGQS